MPLIALALKDLPQRPAVVGLHGKLRSGKDQVYCNMARQCADLGVQVHHISFADPLKEAMLHLFGGERHNYFGTKEDREVEMAFWERRLGPEYHDYRSAMQTFGLRLRDAVAPGILMMSAELRILQILTDRPDQRHLFISADVRYPNEGEAFKELGFPVFEITRQDGVVTKSGLENHPSELRLTDELITHTYCATLEQHPEVARDILRRAGISYWHQLTT